jgi:hypothetical protein
MSTQVIRGWRWCWHTLLGLVVGFLLAIGFVGWLAFLTPGGLAGNDKVQFLMWSIAPVWLLFWSVSYLFSARQWLFAVALVSVLNITLLAYRGVW